MNAKELIDKLSANPTSPLDLAATSAAALPIILRALRLLDAAEANDGNCPETEAAMCRYTGGEPVTFPKGLSAVVPYSFAANLERERNGLAARVRELEGRLSDITAAHHAFLAGNRPDAIDEAIDALVEQMNDEIVDDAERSKP